ncbi:MAG TPA: 2,3-diphosphoglycerate-dependent phosphoglycerate mutase [Candidatus Nitrosotalea sp.]|nr:2,3-diphosphoglycerate-dependent phosphoglycerate mutase [Candidatus Nitrosotalea sp.]
MPELILLRHGESTWNLENRFTGWIDVPLTPTGREEAHSAAAALRGAGLAPRVLHTSLLSRAIETANLVLADLELGWLPVRRSWRLNERHYGALQGLNKAETAARHGEEKVRIWRRSYDVAPPRLEPADPGSSDGRYDDLAPDLIPPSESLKNVVERMLPYWYDGIIPDLRRRGTVLVVAHGNSLRALIKHLDGIADDAISELNIPTGVPRLYRLDDALRPLEASYLGDAGEIEARARAVAEQGRAGGKPSAS